MKSTESVKKIVFTGGHHNSALAVARELIETYGYEVVWFGHKFTMRKDRNVSSEFKEVTAANIKFVELHAGKLYKTFNPIQLLKLPVGFLQAFYLLLKEQPDLVVSFGGYLAAPAVVAAYIQNVPVVTQEQTTVVGLANRLIAHFADKIFITWPQSKIYFDSDKVTVVGLPLRDAIFYEGEKMFGNDMPTLYITGGKQGSHIINEAVLESLEQLLTRFNIIHQTGGNTVHNDLEKLKQKAQYLAPELRQRYIAKDYFYEDEIGKVFYSADIVVSRAGAHTIYEIAALGKVALFIPIPWVSHNEQYKNARILVNEGSAHILPENRLTKETLIVELDTMMNDIDELKSQAEKAKSKIVYNARERMVNEIQKFITQK